MGNFKAGFGAESGGPTAPTPEEISLLMDGELESVRADAVVTSLCRAEGLATWVCYHVIGDAVRGGRVAPDSIPGDSSSVSRPSRRCWRRRAGHPRRMPIALALAATVAAVSVVGWVALTTMPTPVAAIASARQAVGVRAADARPAVDNEYLLVHQEYSPTNAIQGMGPYLRGGRGQPSRMRVGSRPGPARSGPPGCAAPHRGRRRHAACRSRAALAQDAADWLQRAATAARQLNYVGTIVYQHGGRIETSRLVSSRGPTASRKNRPISTVRRARSSATASRCAAITPMPRWFASSRGRMHNAFPSLLPQQLATLATYYQFRKAEIARVAGLETQAYVFEPKDGAALWPQALGRHRHRAPAEGAPAQRTRTNRSNSSRSATSRSACELDREATKPPFATVPPDWQVRESPAADIAPKETGWVVRDMPPGFTKVVEGYRTLRGKPRAGRAYRLFGRAGRRFRCSSSRRRRRRSRSACRSRAASTFTAGSWTTIW